MSKHIDSVEPVWIEAEQRHMLAEKASGRLIPVTEEIPAIIAREHKLAGEPSTNRMEKILQRKYAAIPMRKVSAAD